jgi:hypothetical protein
MGDAITSLTAERIAARDLERRILSIADRMDRQAGRLRERAALLQGIPGDRARIARPYAYHTDETIQDVMSMLANMQLGALTTAAADAESARNDHP